MNSDVERTSGAQGRNACPQCGAPNQPGAGYCVACGSRLGGEVEPVGGENLIIDVSGDEPRIVGGEEQLPPSGRFGGAWYTGERGFVVRGGRRGCLIATVALLLLGCVQCVLAYYVLRWIF